MADDAVKQAQEAAAAAAEALQVQAQEAIRKAEEAAALAQAALDAQQQAADAAAKAEAAVAAAAATAPAAPAATAAPVAPAEPAASGPLDPDQVATIRDGYAFDGAALEMGALVNGDPMPDVPVRIPLAMTNRHGLVAGATGTGCRSEMTRIDRFSASNGRFASLRVAGAPTSVG